jgi:hypothetical protein
MMSYCILIIEDDPAIGQSLVDGFDHHGFDLHLRVTGAGGVD